VTSDKHAGRTSTAKFCDFKIPSRGSMPVGGFPQSALVNEAKTGPEDRLDPADSEW
jgi:hypothetical protein